MLPILCELDRERVMRGVEEDERKLVEGPACIPLPPA